MQAFILAVCAGKCLRSRIGSYLSLALVANFESWMDGTVVILGGDDNIKRFIPGSKFSYEETKQ